MIGTGQTARHTALLIVQVALMLVLCGFLIALGGRYNHRYDMTPQQAFVLSDSAKKIAASVKDPVQVLVFYNGREGERRHQLADRIDQFVDVNPLISYSLYDLDRTPGLAKKYNIENYDTGVVESRGRTVDLAGLNEADLAEALLKVSRARARTLCFLIGHGEHNPETISDRGGYSDVSKALEKENYAITTFEMVPSPEDLKKCTVVLMAGPQKDFYDAEADRLATYLRNGGRIFALVDPETPKSIVAFLARFGVKTGNDLLVDERNRLYGADAFMVRVPIFDKQTFGQSLNLAAVLALVQSVSPVKPAPPDVTVTLVALSSPDSWARAGSSTPTAEIPKFRPNVDINGPLPVGVLATVQHATPDKTGGAAADASGGQMAVFGDSDFPSNFYLNLLGNKDLFMSMVGVLSEEPALVAMRRKGRPGGTLSPIFLTAQQGQVIFSTSVIAVPAFVLLLGGIVAYWRQRQGRKA